VEPFSCHPSGAWNLENLWTPGNEVDGPTYQQAMKTMVGDWYSYVIQSSHCTKRRRRKRRRRTRRIRRRKGGGGGGKE
jgi:hypothetical protein